MRKVTRVQAVLAVAVVLAIAFVLWSGHQNTARAAELPFAIAYTALGEDDPGRVMLYTPGEGDEELAKLRSVAGVKPSDGAMGYDCNNQKWLFFVGDLPKHKGLSVISVSAKGQGTYQLQDDPLGEYDGCRCCIGGGFIYLTIITNLSLCEVPHELSLRCYKMSGELRWSRSLLIPGDSLDEYAQLDPFGATVSPTGLAAISVDTHKGRCTRLLTFDAKGKLLKDLGMGSRPQFDSSGQRLLYSDSGFVKGAHGSDGAGSGNVIIYDMKTSRKRAIPVTSPPGSILPGDFCWAVWSPDGHWLICSYLNEFSDGTSLYAVKIDGPKLVWCKLPVTVGDAWLPVDPALLANTARK